MTRFYDITLPIDEGMVIYPGNPEVGVEPVSRISQGDVANVTRLVMGSHTGTHVDAAHHFIDGAQTVDRLPLDRLIGPAVVLRIPDDVTAIDAHELRRHGGDGEIAPRVLLQTRNSALLDHDHFDRSFAYLTGDGAEYLADAGALLVGIDYLSIEGYGADDHRTHLTLLEREIVVLEGIDLRRVPPGRYELICLPIKVAGGDGAPARVVLRSLD